MRPLSMLLALCVVALLGACKRTTQPPIVQGATAADSAEQVMFGVRTLLFERGVRRGEMLADTAYTFDDQSRFDFRVVHATFKKDNGAPDGTLRADRGNYNLRTQIMEGFGNVVITSVDGRRLTTSHIKYDQSANLVSSDTTFQMTAGDRVSRGIGFTATPNLSSWTCKRACSGEGLINLPAK
jgi:LPS export ABC transporter protein LptC